MKPLQNVDYRSSQMIDEKKLNTLNLAVNDPRLSAAAKAVYTNLALQGDNVSIGQRLLSQNLGIGRATISRATKQLEAAGYLKVEPVGEYGRNTYRLDGTPKKHKGTLAPFKPVEKFDLIGIIKCEYCGRWIDVDNCEALTTEVDEKLKSELVDAYRDSA